MPRPMHYQAGTLPGGAPVSTWHTGSHDGLADAYGRLATWLTEDDRAGAGGAWEVCTWIDPEIQPDPSAWPRPSEWRTRIVQPLE